MKMFSKICVSVIVFLGMGGSDILMAGANEPPPVTGNLKIYNGQASVKPISAKDEEDTGAFTVANLNDTDADGTIDKDDNSVKMNAENGGVDEIDLMKLIIEGNSRSGDGEMRISVKNSVKFWEEPTKEKEVEKKDGLASFDVSKLPVTIWVEATTYSQSLRDIEIKLSYKDTDGTITDDLDVVKATAVWAVKSDYRNKSTQTLWSDVDPNSNLHLMYNTEFKRFGKIFNNPGLVLGKGVYYVNGFEFTVKPPNIGSEKSVKFDATRQKEKKEWGVVAGKVLPNGAHVDFPKGDKANDDPANHGESTKNIKNDHVYTVDGPGIPFRQKFRNIEQIIQRKNFYEFIRVSFDGKRPAGNTLQGSRCSDKEDWSQFMWLVEKNGVYVERQGKPNKVEEGHGILSPAPQP